MKNQIKMVMIASMLAASAVLLSGCGSSQTDEKVDTSKIVPMDKSPVKMEGMSSQGGGGGAAPAAQSAPPTKETLQSGP